MSISNSRRHDQPVHISVNPSMHVAPNISVSQSNTSNVTPAKLAGFALAGLGLLAVAVLALPVLVVGAVGFGLFRALSGGQSRPIGRGRIVNQIDGRPIFEAVEVEQ